MLLQRQFLFQVVDINATFHKAMIAYQILLQSNVGLDTFNYDLIQRGGRRRHQSFCDARLW